MPLDTYVEYKQLQAIEKELKSGGRPANDSNLSHKKSPAEIAAEKASHAASKKDTSLDEQKTMIDKMSLINPNNAKSDFVYRPGGIELKEALEEEWAKEARSKE